MKKIKIGIADEHRIFRDILKGFLSQQDVLDPVLEAESANDLLKKLTQSDVEILVIDLLSPAMGGSETLRLIHAQFPRTRVIVLSMSADLELINELLDIGIHAFISKADQPENLLQAIMTAAENEMYKNELLTEALYSIRHTNLRAGSKNSSILLNEREKRIIQMLWEEKSNKDIADEIFLSVRSIEKIRQDLKEKLGAKSTIGLIKYALTNKIIASGNRAAGLQLS